MRKLMYFTHISGDSGDDSNDDDDDTMMMDLPLISKLSIYIPGIVFKYFYYQCSLKAW